MTFDGPVHFLKQRPQTQSLAKVQCKQFQLQQPVRNGFNSVVRGGLFFNEEPGKNCGEHILAQVAVGLFPATQQLGVKPRILLNLGILSGGFSLYF